MAVIERNMLLRCKDDSGNEYLLYPITRLDCVDGAEDLLHYGEAQALTDAEKNQALTNIGALRAPEVTVEDDGKVLMVVDGKWAAENMEIPEVDTTQIDQMQQQINAVQMQMQSLAEMSGAVTMEFRNYDGTLLYSRLVTVGDPCSDPVEQGVIDTPVRNYEGADENEYVWTGWSLTEGGDADDAALTNITENRVVYATFMLRYTIVLPEQELAFTYNSNANYYNVAGIAMTLTPGETYTVVWDGSVYTCTCAEEYTGKVSGLASTISCTYVLGNIRIYSSFFGYSITWTAPISSEPFVFLGSTSGSTLIATKDTSETHTVFVYKDNFA